MNDTDLALENAVVGAVAGPSPLLAGEIPEPPRGQVKIERLYMRDGSGRLGRNSKCPCDSGKKYKKCCHGLLYRNAWIKGVLVSQG